MSWIYDLLGNMMQIFEDSKGQVPKLFVIEKFCFFVLLLLDDGFNK